MTKAAYHVAPVAQYVRHPRHFDMARVIPHPNRSAITDSLKWWAGEVRALGLDTLQGCTIKVI